MSDEKKKNQTSSKCTNSTKIKISCRRCYSLPNQTHISILPSKRNLNKFYFPYLHFLVSSPLPHLGSSSSSSSSSQIPLQKKSKFKKKKKKKNRARTRTTEDPAAAAATTTTTTTTDLQSHPKNTVPLQTSQTQKTPHHHNNNNNNNSNPKSAQLSPLISTPQTSLPKSNSSAMLEILEDCIVFLE